MMPKISACCIVKNEEKNLPIWLENMSEIADEIIVVDTGSSDNSVALAEKYGANVYFFRWVNDFAAAKNYAINQATGDWIFFLDADEYFTDKTLVKLPAIMKEFHKKKNVGCILCRLTNIDVDRNNALKDSFLQVRIFRNSSNIRYEGAVHEQLKNNGTNMDMVYNKDIEILHTGYSSSITASKARRNLEILHEQENKEYNKNNKKLLIYFMDAYNTLGEYSKSLEYGKKSLKAGIELVGLEGHIQLVMLENMRQLKYSSIELHDFLDDAIKRYPENPSFSFSKVYLYYQDGNYLECLKWINNGLDKAKKMDLRLERGEGQTNIYKRDLPSMYSVLGKILLMKGDCLGAIGAYEKGIKIDRRSVELLQGFFHCIENENSVTVIQVLNNLYDTENDAEFIVESLSGIATSDVISYYANKICRNVDGMAFLGTHHFDAAAVEYARQLERNHIIAVACIKNMKIELDEELDVIMSPVYNKVMHKDSISNDLGMSRYERAVARVLKK